MSRSIKKFTTIFFFGISSGLPISLVLSTLKVMLVDNGFDLKTIGFFSLVSIPYSFKFLISPFIDSLPIPFLTKKIGHRKSWIIISQLFLTIFIFLLGIVQITNSIMLIALFSILVAISSASQDIVIDAYRIELIKTQDQGLASSYYVYGYRLGMLISGALALAMSEFFSWQIIYGMMSLIMIIFMSITVIAEESRINWRSKNQNLSIWIKNFIIEPFIDFSKKDKWFLILIFIILFKLTDIFAGNLTMPFLIEIGYSKIEIATILKTFGLFATLLGVLVGGYIVKKLGLKKSIWLAISLQGLSNLLFSIIAIHGKDNNLLYLVIFFENSSGGIGDSVFIAYLSSLCNVVFSATQYSLLSSLASFSRSFLSSSAGIFAESLGWFKFFVLSSLLIVPSIILLFFIRIKKEK